MISFICCSIRPQEAVELRANILRTIGDTPFELIVFDNRNTGIGLCKVYNRCAAQAKYDYLCFLHEDIIFYTHDWGAKIVRKLSEPDCGVVGFAGSVVKLNIPTGWYTHYNSTRVNYIQDYRDRNPQLGYRNPGSKDYNQVITLDGMCLFVRRSVWDEVKFDQNRFRGFHAYDLDFTIAVARKYKNYVCYEFIIEHKSPGSFNAMWKKEANRLDTKWLFRLPLKTEAYSDLDVRNETYNLLKDSVANNDNSLYDMRHMIRFLYTYRDRESWRLLKSYLRKHLSNA